ncbi:tyrosine-type recombinase/integrase [Mesorhizobium australicum]|uniref:Tyrosine-type recombinase/integrase n=1 Tax=Mesorhizobium australicum TaxID=536018 RepID=A0ACC6SWJ8_9HYPH
MAKTLVEAKITTPSARKDLPVGLHWRGLDREVHLGYRKGKRGGVWLVRWRNGIGYKQAAIGNADDSIKAGNLSFQAAEKAARALVERERQLAASEAEGPALTVAKAVADYIAARDDRDAKRAGRAIRSDAARRLGRHVLGQPARGKEQAVPATDLAGLTLYMLTENDLQAWRASLPAPMKATTRQRLINDLKAALNSAYNANRAKLLPSVPAIIKHGLRAPEHTDEADPVARDNQILSDADIARVLRAAREVDAENDMGGDLFRIVLVLAATGARFSQVARIRVGDCQIAAGRIMVPVSRKGRRAKSGSITVPVGRDVIEALVPVVTGRASDAILLERQRYEQVKGIQWQRAGRGPWQSAEMVRPWQAIKERAELPDLIPYALRHSSIVKGIRANLPIRLVAALHDTSIAMIERHYTAWVTSGLEEMARAAIVPLVPQEGNNVVQIGART